MQKQLQLVAVYSSAAQTEVWSQVKPEVQQFRKPSALADLSSVTVGEEWLLERHLVYCGDTKSEEFIDRSPLMRR